MIVSCTGLFAAHCCPVKPPRPVGTFQRGYWSSLEPNRTCPEATSLRRQQNAWRAPALPFPSYIYLFGSREGSKDDSVKVASGRPGPGCRAVMCFLEGGCTPRGLRKLFLKKCKAWGLMTHRDLLS